MERNPRLFGQLNAPISLPQREGDRHPAAPGLPSLVQYAVPPNPQRSDTHEVNPMPYSGFH